MEVKMPQTVPLVSPASLEPDRSALLAENRTLIQAVRKVNEAELMGQDNELSYQVDRDTHRVILRLVNRKTNEVIRQIPPEYVLQLAREMREQCG